LYKKYNIPVLSFFILILALPFVGIFTKVNYDLDSIINFLINPYTQRIIFFSLFQAILSAIICCIIAIPLALALNRHKNYLIIKSIISLCGFSFVIPSILIVYAVIKIYGYNGFLNTNFNFYNILSIESIYGIKAILIAHILLNTPFATRLFVQNLNNIPKNYYEISKTLNISIIGNIVKLEIPIIKQNLFTIFSIIFSLCFLSFAIVMALGGGPRNSTLEVAIYQYALFELNFNKAIILSFIQIFICLFFVIIGFFKLKGSNFFEINIKSNNHPHKDYKLIKIFDFSLITCFVIFLFSPIVFLLSDFINVDFSKVVFNKTLLKAFANSFIISVITGSLVSVFGFIISCLIIINYKNTLLQQLLFLSSSIIIIISPIIFSLGYFIILQKFIHILFFKFIVIILINIIFLLPFAILILFSCLKNTYLSYKDTRIAFRIDLFDYFRILFPLLKKNLFYVFSFSTVITFGDFTIISFFRSESFETLPSYLFKLISVYKFNEASFVAGIILGVSMLIYFFIDNLTHQGSPDIKT
jgi:thiamine transport system permease protein